MNKYYVMFCVFAVMQTMNGAESSKVLAWDAENYKQNSSPQDHFAQYALTKIFLVENYKVLDVGCGNGKTTSFIATQVPNGKVVGIDSSKDMIHVASCDYRQKNLKFKVMDVLKLKDESKFDIAVAFNSLPWVGDQRTAYQNIGKSLVRSGKLLALVSDFDSPVLRAYQATFTYSRWSPYFKDYKPAYYPCTEEEVKNYIDAAALKPLTVKKAEIPSRSMSKETFIKVLAGTPGARDVIPQEQYMDYLKDVVAEYLKIVPEDANGDVILDAGLILVIAEKP